MSKKSGTKSYPAEFREKAVRLVTERGYSLKQVADQLECSEESVRRFLDVSGTIAEWLGHSVKIMLEHYGRVQQSDFDQIAEACEQVKERKDQTTQKVAQYTAVLGGIGQNGAESPSFMELVQLLTGTALNDTKWQEKAPCVNYPKCPNRMEMDSNPRYVSARRFSRPVP